VNVRRLGVLQWVGLLLGAAVWVGQHIVGWGVTTAECGAGGAHWGLDNDVWQGTMMGVALGFVLLAELAALAVFRRTRGADFGDGPPEDDVRFHGALPYTRLHFFATASLVVNLLMALIIVLDGVASVADVTCRQS